MKKTIVSIIGLMIFLIILLPILGLVFNIWPPDCKMIGVPAGVAICQQKKSGAGFDFAGLIGMAPKISTEINKSGNDPFALFRPKYPGSRSSFAFPPSCAMLPDKIAQTICADFKAGYLILWPMQCDALPIPSAVKLCQDERNTAEKYGHQVALKLRQNKDWWKIPRLNVYVWGDTRMKSEELAPDANIWGSNFFNYAEEIFYPHAVGTRKVVSHSSGYVADREDKLPAFDKIKDAVALDLDGNSHKTTEQIGGTTAGGPLTMDIINPSFQQYLIDSFKAQVDLDADGILIDDVGVGYPTMHFNDTTVKIFADFMKTTAPAKLTALGIDPNNFNYKTFLRSRGYTAAKLTQNVFQTSAYKSIPLMTEFWKFLDQKKGEALTDIIKQVRDYAASKGRSDLVVSTNNGELSPQGTYLEKLLDFQTFEHNFISPSLVFNSVIPLDKMAQAKNKPLVNQILVDDWTTLRKLPFQTEMDIRKVAAMEAFAGDSTLNFTRLNHKMYETTNSTDIYLAYEDRSDLLQVQQAYGFMRKYKEIFQDYTDTQAKVAVLLDNDLVISQWQNSLTMDHYLAVWNLDKALYAAGIPFDVVNYDQAAAGQYKYILLASGSSVDKTKLSAAQAKGAQLLEYSAPAEILGKLSALKLITNLPAGTGYVANADKNGNWAIHLFNYNLSASGFKEINDLNLNFNFDVTKYDLSYASLENHDFVDLKTATIPQLKTYGLLLLKKK